MLHPDLAGVRTLIFDMDGTLINSEKVTLRSLRNGLKQFYESIGQPLPPRTDKELLSGIGAPSHVFFSNLLDDRNKPQWEEFRRIIIEHEKIHLADTRITFPGTIKTLRTLKNRGYKLALVSNCGAPYLQAVLDTQNLRSHFEKAMCIGDREGSTKTELIAEVAAELGGKAAVIGDRAYDVEAATANGLPAVGALYGYGSREELFGTATWVEDIRHLLYLFNPVRELAARIAAEANRLRPLDRPFVIALESPHEMLSFPLSQHIFNELADLNIPAAHLHLESYRRNGLNAEALQGIHDCYPWDVVNSLLEQRLNGSIDLQIPGDGSEIGRPLRARAGGVVLIEGDFLAGDWVTNSFDYYVKLESQHSTISRFLQSTNSLTRHLENAGAVEIPADLTNTSSLHENWTSVRSDVHRQYIENDYSPRENVQGLIVDGDHLQRGLIHRSLMRGVSL